MIRFAINPMKGYVNQPGLKLWGVKEEIVIARVQVMWDTDGKGSYWRQCPKTGYTEYKFHDRALRNVTANIWETTLQDGYGGRTFEIGMKDNRIIRLRGPWSSGCYHLNSLMPKPTMECVSIEHSGGICAAYTLERINDDFLKGTPWKAEIRKKCSSDVWPELTHFGAFKDFWSKTAIDELDREYKLACENNQTALFVEGLKR